MRESVYWIVICLVNKIKAKDVSPEQIREETLGVLYDRRPKPFTRVFLRGKN